ncbi:hypothetical protein L1987_21600 [Smallanthus sonchifolius]|uniref:Uncharacterized protein n=1 Tax=Smallanthus sonchifolius TaxID=185202 RepID=A0ACB9IC97_9ASTR|nr:hypothetical protein L1987_21600 [Smallanthus sonchifolius]
MDEEKIIPAPAATTHVPAQREVVKEGNMETQGNDKEGFTTVTKKRRRIKIKMQGKQGIQGRHVRENKKTEQPKGNNTQRTTPNTSSDPNIQRKMSYLHSNFIAVNNQNHRAQRNNSLTRTHPNSVNGKSAQNHNPHIPSSTPGTSQKHSHHGNPLNPPSRKPSLPKKHLNHSSPPTTGTQLQQNNSNNKFAALDTDMAVTSDGPDCNPSDDQDTFYEFSEDTIANVLNFNPSSLVVPRVNDMDLDLGETEVHDVPSDDEVPDFDITNA